MHLLQFFPPEMGSLAFRSQGAETKKLVGGNPSVLTKGRRAVAVAKFWEARSGHYNCRKILAPSVPTISEITGIWQERAPKERESERNECAGREFAVFGVRLWGRSTSLSVCCAPRTNIELADVRVRERNARRQTKRKGTLGNARKRNGSATAPAFLLLRFWAYQVPGIGERESRNRAAVACSGQEKEFAENNEMPAVGGSSVAACVS